jgi:hypothetical protein
MYSRFLTLLLCVFAMASMAAAQTAGATITGTVTDPTGAVIPDITVVATHLDSGTVVNGVTSATGNYTIPQLRVGNYNVVVEHAGFKTFRRGGIALLATQTLRLDISLEVGATSESVTVTAEASLLKTESGALSHNILPSSIQNLPLLPVGTFIRDPFALANAVPGVLQNFVATVPSPVRTRCRKSPCRPATSPLNSDPLPAASSTFPSSPAPTSFTVPFTTTPSMRF